MSNDITAVSDVDVANELVKLAQPDAPVRRSMSDTLRAHRDGYTAAAAYSGKASLHNGDDIAIALQGLSPQQVLSVAQSLADSLGTSVDLEAKYVGTNGWTKPRLNLGQIRMNSGNRIRGAIKRGDAVASEIHALIKALV